MTAQKTLRLVLGDQLNHAHSWYKQVLPHVTYLLIESRQETDYVSHHIQKVTAFFLAMRHFAEHLRGLGHQCILLTLDHEANRLSLTDTLLQHLQSGCYECFEYQLPDEHRLDTQLQAFCQSLTIQTKACDTEHFLTERLFLQQFFKGKKTYLMESFYRQMRKKYGILMQQNEPEGGKWNFDADNRKKYDGKVQVKSAWPSVPHAEARRSEEVAQILDRLNRHQVATIGRIDAQQFHWPTDREQSLTLLQYFVDEQLPYFGTYQDAMDTKHPYLFHSRLSFALNVKLLHPLEVVNAAIAAYRRRPEAISLAQVEGFVRQIIGWREYMRGVYWAHMPQYASLNYFAHRRRLPAWFWSGQTRMNCLKHAIGQSLDYAYAHHIQRLMVTGNFALLAGIDPTELDAWYLGIYIDAIEWVEITNTRGMSQFADGGLVGTKPYVSSANYMDKMSNYCQNCVYDKKQKVGEKACPFNSLYWHFYHRNRALLANNPRIGMMYITWDKTDKTEQTRILQHAEALLTRLEDL